MSWTVHHGSGSLLVLTNETGETATEVEFRLKGRAVGGMFGQPDWSLKRPEMAPGAAVEAVFKAAWGAPSDPPRVEIEWTDSKGDGWETVIELPI